MKTVRLTLEKKIRTVKLIDEFDDLRPALMASRQAYGLTAYDRSEFNMKVANHFRAGVRKYYLTEAQELVYVTQPHGEIGKIVHQFDWSSCMHNGAAAVCNFSPDMKQLMIGDYKYDRDSLRQVGGFWTVDSIDGGTVL